VEAAVDRITYDELEAMLRDPDVPDDRIAPYLTVDEEDSSAFDPRVVPDREKVELGPEGEFRTENAMRWANDVARWRRAARFRRRLPGSDLPVLVSEGDSWFQFPFLVEETVDQLGEDHLVWSLDAAGDTAENMVNRRPEYMKGLQAQKRNGLAGFLFSAAGNDVIGEDALGSPVLLRLLKQHDPDRDAAWHVDQAELARVLTFLEDCYRTVVRTVRADEDLARLPVFVHAYDYAIPGGQPGDPRRPRWAAQDKWLGKPLRERGIEDAGLQREIIRILIDATYDMLARVAGDPARTGVHVVDVRGTLPQVTDWADEIHATDAGYRRVADRFRAVMGEAGVGA
jgi:hypothetical protein